MDDYPSKFSRLEKIERAMFSNPRGDRPESRRIDSGNARMDEDR